MNNEQSEIIAEIKRQGRNPEFVFRRLRQQMQALTIVR